MKTTDKPGDIATGHDRFEISKNFFLYFRPSGMICCEAALQVALTPEV